MSKGENDEWQDILHDPNIGVDVADRKAKFAEGKKVSRIISIAGVVAGVWVWVSDIWNSSYDIAVVIALFFPLIVILIFNKYKYATDLIQGKKVSIKPSFDVALFVPSVCLLFTAIGYELLNYWLCIIPVVVLYVIFACVFYLVLPKSGKGTSKFDCFFAAILMLPYCFASSVIINCHYDNSKTSSYQAIVIGKYETHGKGTAHYLRLKKWGPKNEDNEIKVSSTTYLKIHKGQQVTMDVSEGLLHVPWYYLEK
jgi:hypothetical protein